MQVDQSQPGQAPAAYFRAARGDHDAQADMAELVLMQGLRGDLPVNDAIMMALTWAQMASTSRKSQHLLRYAGLLLAQETVAPAKDALSGTFDDSCAMALAITDAVADAGHSRAEIIACALAARLSPEVIAEAVRLKAQFSVARKAEGPRSFEIASQMMPDPLT